MSTSNVTDQKEFFQQIRAPAEHEQSILEESSTNSTQYSVLLVRLKSFPV